MIGSFTDISPYIPFVGFNENVPKTRRAESQFEGLRAEYKEMGKAESLTSLIWNFNQEQPVFEHPLLDHQEEGYRIKNVLKSMNAGDQIESLRCVDEIPMDFPMKLSSEYCTFSSDNISSQ